jgi:hypothetical protein
MIEEHRQRVWRLCGWYSGLMLLQRSSSFGVLTWLQNEFDANDATFKQDLAEGYRIAASSQTLPGLGSSLWRASSD